MTPQEAYHAAATRVDGAISAQMFGKPCYTIAGSSFVSFFQEEMAFKLAGDEHTEALALAGAQLFDPSQKGRPFKAWVQVPFEHADRWPELAQSAARLANNSKS